MMRIHALALNIRDHLKKLRLLYVKCNEATVPVIAEFNSSPAGESGGDILDFMFPFVDDEDNEGGEARGL